MDILLTRLLCTASMERYVFSGFHSPLLWFYDFLSDDHRHTFLPLPTSKFLVEIHLQFLLIRLIHCYRFCLPGPRDCGI